MALPSIPQPVAVFGNLLIKKSETLVLKEKMLSVMDDSFDIKLKDGTPILRAEKRLMSFSGRKAIYDRSNKHLFDLRKEHLHLHPTFTARIPNGRTFLKVKSGFSLVGSKATATITTSDGSTRILRINGSFRNHAAEIVERATGAVAARIRRRILNGGELLFDKHTYHVTVAPGVDLAVVAAICICLDQGKGN